MVMPAPGAVWPAMVMSEFSMVTVLLITPLTSKTTIRGPAAAHASCSEPGPSGLRFVTIITLPPRPPGASHPQPSAPGNAGKGFSSARATDSTPNDAVNRTYVIHLVLRMVVSFPFLSIRLCRCVKRFLGVRSLRPARRDGAQQRLVPPDAGGPSLHLHIRVGDLLE